MLVVEGGSITYGDGLLNLKDAWPYYVDENAVNLALKGKSPDHIEMSLLSYYYTQSKFDECIIAWPSVIRKCLFKADTREYIDFNAIGLFSDYYKDDRFVREFYKKYYCQFESLKTHWLRCLKLIAWFKQHNIRWMMINQDRVEQEIYNGDKSLSPWFHNTNDEQIKKIISDLQILEAEILKNSNYVLFKDYFMSGYQKNSDDHPSKEEHKIIGNHIKGLWDGMH